MHQPWRRALACALVAIVLAGGCSSGSKPDAKSPQSTTTTSVPKKRPDPGTERAGDAESAAYKPTGKLVADNGFRPDVNGFGFENYGTEDPPDVANLDAEAMRRLFGDKVCSNMARGKCDLTPPAEQWMDDVNKSTDGGHCQGFSVLSGLFWKKAEDVNKFGAPSTPDLTIDGNTPLQHEIAYAFSFQNLDAYNAAIVTGTPNDILDKLIQVLRPDNKDSYTLGIYKPGFEGGHAVTPYAVEDAGNGTFHVLIYDNNYPKVTRAITIDRNANTWTYDAATNPSEESELYQGDATTKTIDLEPTSAGVGVQPCPFCGKRTPSEGDDTTKEKGSTGPEMDEIYLAGSDVDHAHLLITDPSGHRVGYVDGKFVNDMPGADVVFSKASKNWAEDIEPDYYVPDGIDYKVTIDGSGLDTEDDTLVGVIGSSFDVTFDNLTIHPGEKATFTMDGALTKITFASTGEQTPSVEVGWSDDIDYDFTLSGATVKPGSSLDIGVPDEVSDLILTNTPGSSLDFTFDRSDEDDSVTFKHDHIALGAGDKAVFHYGPFADKGDSVALDLTHNGSTGTQQLANQGS
jgi:hypothetical protein